MIYLSIYLSICWDCEWDSYFLMKKCYCEMIDMYKQQKNESSPPPYFSVWGRGRWKWRWGVWPGQGRPGFVKQQRKFHRCHRCWFLHSDIHGWNTFMLTITQIYMCVLASVIAMVMLITLSTCVHCVHYRGRRRSGGTDWAAARIQPGQQREGVQSYM